MLSVPLCVCACPRLNFQLFLTHVSSLQIVIATSGSSSHTRELVQGMVVGCNRRETEIDREYGIEWFIVVCGINGPIHQPPFCFACTIKHLNELNRGDLAESMLFGWQLDFIKFDVARKLILTH